MRPHPYTASFWVSVIQGCVLNAMTLFSGGKSTASTSQSRTQRSGTHSGIGDVVFWGLLTGGNALCSVLSLACCSTNCGEKRVKRAYHVVCEPCGKVQPVQLMVVNTTQLADLCAWG